jgi:hypothetical protein
VAYRTKVGKELAGHGETAPGRVSLKRYCQHDSTPFVMCAGLLYEDVMIETEEVKLALSRLPKELLDAREQRLKRAMILSSQSKRVRARSLDCGQAVAQGREGRAGRATPKPHGRLGDCALSSGFVTPLSADSVLPAPVPPVCPQLPPDVQAQIEPFTPYLSPYLEAIEKEKAELLLAK